MILGIESSCDEFSLSLYRPENGIVGEWTHSQIIKHAEYGGVVPDLAVVEHLNNFIPLLNLARSNINISREVKKIAVTCGPGLVGSLGVGLSVAKTLGMLWSVPVFGVNHLRGHAFSPFIDIKDWDTLLPHLGLLVSGGNTILFCLDEKREISILARTVDDAVGEALDKGAKLMGIPYPGGAEMERLAKNGDQSFYDFPKAFPKKSDMKFSFSGLKTSLLYRLQKMAEDEISENYANLLASYQWAAVQQLVRKTSQALELREFRSVGLSGGVANNQLLRDQMTLMANDIGMPLLSAKPKYTGDNATMIAFASHVDSSNLFANEENYLTFIPSLRLD